MIAAPGREDVCEGRAEMQLRARTVRAQASESKRPSDGPLGVTRQPRVCDYFGTVTVQLLTSVNLIPVICFLVVVTR